MNVLYLDCFAGISGDMTIGALLDAGASFDHLEQELKKLNLDEEYQLQVSKVNKNGITATKFDCIYGNNLNNTEEKTHHRTYKDIQSIISTSTLEEPVKKISLEIFHLIAVAESIIHGVSIDTVHFHEVGAIDSIVDITGTAILLNELDIEYVVSKPVPTGKGKIHIEHGLYPVPAPATMEILKNVPLQETTVDGELTTPTGAAFVKALTQEFKDTLSMTVHSIGYGAGTKNFEQVPNVLRVLIGS